MKEMVAGCCVCSDERGWTENPLVYCDGIGCNIGVHQACYGIVSVPDGNWYCRKCESQERSARVRCELCPSKDGALKRTDNGGWAHVVCGLYIPEVRFGSVTTMEPIVLSQIPTERYNKVCYICEQNNRGSRASMGACMQCNKAGCKQQFHVTCAQAMGLLCEEAGNYLDNVKYCGYCQEHYNKLKKGANVKTIPAYRPLSSNNSGSEDSPEKKLPSNHNQSLTDPKQTTKRKSSSNRPVSQNGPPRATPADKKEILADNLNGSVSANLSLTSTASYSCKNDNSSRFTTSNFVESVIIPSESVFADMQKSKKRKLNEQQSSLSLNLSSNATSDLIDHNLNKPNSVDMDDTNCDNDDNEEDSPLKFIEEPNLSSLKTETLSAAVADIHNSSPCTVTNVTTNIYSTSTTSISSTSSVSPFTGSSCTFTNPVSSSYLTSSTTFADVKTSKNDSQVDKGRSKVKRSVSSTNSTKKSHKISNDDHDAVTVNGPTEPPVSFSSNNSNMLYSERLLSSQSALSVKSEPEPLTATNIPVGTVESKESPPTSPENAMAIKLSKNDERTDKEMKTFQSGSSAPHMLGNQLNPASSMAQKMSDALNDELEAHSIFTTADVNSSASSFVGPPLYNKIISTTRATDSSKRSNSPSNGPLASLSGSAANFPQSLEELLETQWEQGGTFLMEQAQHFDIASLLTCLHKLREENLGLEETIRKLKARRDHLLGVNARLAMPLAPISQPVNNIHTPSQTPPQQQHQQQQQHSTSVSQTITQQTSNQQHHGQQMSLVSPPSQLQQVSLCTQQKQSANLTINSLPPGISDPSNSMRNIPLPPAGIYAGSCNTSTTLRGPHAAVYQNTHTMENGLLSNPSHHQSPQQQHTRGLSGQVNTGTARHLSSASNASLYSNSQPISNQGVVVRTPNLSDISRTDRRNTTVVSSNYQPAYQISSLSHQQQMSMHREDVYHSAHAKPN